MHVGMVQIDGEAVPLSRGEVYVQIDSDEALTLNFTGAGFLTSITLTPADIIHLSQFLNSIAAVLDEDL